MSANDEVILSLIEKDAEINIFNEEKQLLPRSNDVWSLIRDKLDLKVQSTTF